MKNVSIVLLTLVLALAGVYGYRTTQAQTAAAEQSSIGAVNVAKILLQSQEKLDRERAVRARAQQVNQQLERLNSEIGALQRELEQALEPGTEAYRQTLQEYFDKRALAEAYRQGQQEVMAREAHAWMQDIYARLLQEVSRIARQRGLRLIINYDEMPYDPEDLETMILTRNVLYCAPTMDLTAEVLEAMDAAYAAAQAATR